MAPTLQSLASRRVPKPIGASDRATLLTGSRPSIEMEGMRLGQLVGAARARVLLAVSTAKTTNEVARELLLAPSTVSEHLKHLTQAGVVARARRGRHVHYEQTDLGRRLIALLAA